MTGSWRDGLVVLNTHRAGSSGPSVNSSSRGTMVSRSTAYMKVCRHICRQPMHTHKLIIIVVFKITLKSPVVPGGQ